MIDALPVILACGAIAIVAIVALVLLLKRSQMLEKVLKVMKWVVAGLAVAALVFLFVGLLVMWLWNWLMPVIFGLPTIGYWQAWGLLLLAHILLGGGDGSRHKSNGSHHGGGFRWHMRERLSKPDESAEAAAQPEAS